MKNFKKIVFTFILCFSMSIAYAGSCDKDFSAKVGLFVKQSTTQTYYKIPYEGNWVDEQTNLSFFEFYEDGNPNPYSGICRQAGVEPAKNMVNDWIDITGNIDINCIERLLDPANAPTLELGAYQAGIIHIMDRDDIGYAAKTATLRVYDLMWRNQAQKYDPNSDKKPTYFFDVFRDLYNKLLLNSKVSNAMKEIRATFQTKGADVDALKNPVGNSYNNLRIQSSSIKWYDTDNQKYITDDIHKAVTTLLVEALQAANYYAQNDGATSVDFPEKPVIVNETTEENGIRNYKETHFYEIKLKNFKRNPSAIVTFKCNNCDALGIEAKLTVNNDDKNPGTEVDVLENRAENLITVPVEIEFTGTSDRYSCQKIDYTLTLDYKEDTVSTEVYKVQEANCGNCQEFYVLYAEDVEQKIERKYSDDLCNEPNYTCEETELLCEEGDEAACTWYEENCDDGDDEEEEPADCTTYIQNSQCTEEDSYISIVEGMDFKTTSRNCKTIDQTSFENEDVNVLQCIIEGKDEVGNSYELKDAVDSEYCAIYCKEDYHMVLPGQKATNSGRYFSLEATVRGAKTCYTSEIDTEKFEEDLDKQETRIMSAYNDWNKWSSLLTNSCMEEFVDGYFSEYYDDRDRTNDGDGWLYCSIEEDEDDERYYIEWEYEKVSEDGEYYNWINGYRYDKVEAGKRYNTDDYTPEEILEDILDEVSEASETLDKRTTAYIKVINQYNQCSGTDTMQYSTTSVSADTFGEGPTSSSEGWKMDYNYEPTIKFWYEESYFDEAFHKELITESDPTKSNVTQTVCSGDVDKNYNCNTSTSSKASFTERERVLCVNEGIITESYVDAEKYKDYQCIKITIEVTDAKYVKQQMTVEANYKTPTQFINVYNHGGIINVENINDDIDEDEIEKEYNGSILHNSLPVSLGTAQGVYNYALKIEDLGEYYDKNDELGRLWGDDNSVVNAVLSNDDYICANQGSLVNNAEDIALDNGVYVCAYLVNLPNDDDPDDECNPRHPEWNEDTQSCDPSDDPDNPDDACNPNDPDSPGYNPGWEEDGWKNGCEPQCGDDCPVVCEPTCENPYCPDNDCPVECENGKCVYTNGNLNVSYKPTSTGNVNPSDRVLGSNWHTNNVTSSTPMTVSTSLALKAWATTQEIESNGESIYNDNDGGDTNPPLAGNTGMRVKLDSDVINFIKNYNDQNESYTNNTLECYDYKYNDETYDNIYCYSTFIDDLIEEAPNSVTIIGGTRPTPSERDNKDDQAGGYWTPFDQNDWITGTSSGIDYKALGIGPSWK